MRASLLAIVFSLAGSAPAQDGGDLEPPEQAATMDLDSLIASFEWRAGTIILEDGVASLNLAPSHKFLHYDQAYHLLVEVWNNPPGLTEGLAGVVIPADAGVYDDRPAYLIYHEWSGYISDTEAQSIDYDAKLKDMIRADSADNEQRRALGYDGLQLIGWAKAPYYDPERKALHWAKEMVSDRSELNVLNYNVKLLGRRGILTVNAITTMDHLDAVQDELPAILEMLRYNDGYRYDQFDPRTDSRSDTSLSALIDGLEPDRTMERIKQGIKLAAILFFSALGLLIGLWFLFVRRKR